LEKEKKKEPNSHNIGSAVPEIVIMRAALTVKIQHAPSTSYCNILC